jgi:hypothetical protein
MRSAIVTATAILLAAMFVKAATAADALNFLLQPTATTQPSVKPLSAKDAGARYGEAAGAALVCYGLKITPQVAELRGRYQGADLAEFDAQAGKVLKAWRETLNCEHAEGPNDCKVSQQWSCRQAMQEIGPSGSELRGLVEPKD